MKMAATMVDLTECLPLVKLSISGRHDVVGGNATRLKDNKTRKSGAGKQKIELCTKVFEVSNHFTKKETFMSTIKAILAGLVGVSLCMANISGTVTDTSGTPITGAAVSLEKGGQTATSGADGSFTLGTTLIKEQLLQTNPYKLSANINNGFLYVSLQEKSAVDIVTYNLQGKAISTVLKTIGAGTHSIALPQRGAGVYLYKIKSGSNEFVLKANSIGGVSQGAAVSAQGFSSYNALAKQGKSTVAINDVIAVTKAGYLNYRVIATNSDTGGIEIKMIVCEGTVTDVDGNVYQTVKIGNQVWTVENLRTTKYNDGSAIPLVTDSAAWVDLPTPGYCYYNNTTNADSIKRYGALYSWYTVNTGKLAPTGWHVPDTTEWNTLENYLIANGYNWDRTTDSNKIAKSLATKTDWFAYVDIGTIGNDLTKNNRSGFSALPGGAHDHDGRFVGIGDYGFWWSATELPPTEPDVWSLGPAEGWLPIAAFGRCLYNLGGYLGRLGYAKGIGFSVRLVRDN